MSIACACLRSTTPHRCWQHNARDFIADNVQLFSCPHGSRAGRWRSCQVYAAWLRAQRPARVIRGRAAALFAATAPG